MSTTQFAVNTPLLTKFKPRIAKLYPQNIPGVEKDVSNLPTDSEDVQVPILYWSPWVILIQQNKTEKSDFKLNFQARPLVALRYIHSAAEHWILCVCIEYIIYRIYRILCDIILYNTLYYIIDIL